MVGPLFSSLDSNLCQHEIQDRFWLLCLTPYMLFSSSGINSETLKHFSFWSLFCKGLYQWGGKQTVKGCVGSSFMPGRRNKCFKAFRQLLSLGVLSAQCPNSSLFSVFSFPWEGDLCIWARIRSLSGVIRFWGRIIKVQDHGTYRGVSPQLSWIITWKQQPSLPVGDKALDVICRRQAAPVVLTFLWFSAAGAY